MQRDRHVVPWVEGNPKRSCLQGISLELVFDDGKVGVDDDEEDVNAMNQFLINASDFGKDGFILKCLSCDIAGI